MGSPICSKVDVNGGRIQKFMSKQSFDSQQIRPIFVEVGSKGMPKGVAGKLMIPPEGGFRGVDELIDGKRSHGLIGMPGIGEKIAPGHSVLEPVLSQYGKGITGEYGVTVRTVF